MKNGEDLEVDLMCVLDGGDGLQEIGTGGNCMPGHTGLSPKSGCTNDFKHITDKKSGKMSAKMLKEKFYGQLQKLGLQNVAIHEHGPAVQVDVIDENGQKIVSIDIAPHFDLGPGPNGASKIYVPKAPRNQPDALAFFHTYSLEEKAFFKGLDRDGGCRKMVLRCMKVIYKNTTKTYVYKCII